MPGSLARRPGAPLAVLVLAALALPAPATSTTAEPLAVVHRRRSLPMLLKIRNEWAGSIGFWEEWRWDRLIRQVETLREEAR